MKKILFGIIASLVALVAFSGSAHAATPPNWDLSGNYTIDFVWNGGHYLNDVTLSQNGNKVTGTIHYPNPGPTYTVSGTVNGSVSGDTINLRVQYNDRNYARTMTGSIVSTGNMSGNWNDANTANDHGTWLTIAGNAQAKSNGSIAAGIGFTAYGLHRNTAASAKNTGTLTNATGWFNYTDANGDWYIVQVKYLNTSGNTAWYAGPVLYASNHTWVGNWLFAKTQGVSPNPIKTWGSFTTQSAAIAGVNSKADPKDGPFTVTSGGSVIH